uniref:Si:dkey-24f15.2 n=1 Tax=Cyprinus carpio carpio TaxID=630221 RepID=A0A8C0Y407_CYPCA
WSGMKRLLYETPSIADLQCLLLTNRQPFGPVSLIWPATHFGSMALDKGLLTDLGITHVFYSDMSISYCGVEASDHPQFDLSQYFCSTASFIKAALTQNGKFDFLDLFLTNFSALVLAFLMMCENLTITDAIIAVRLNRDICPNSGFLEHLRDLVQKFGVG